MPPSTPRQDMTTAFGASPPSRISSQPTSLRPCAVRNSSIRCVNQLCSSSSFFKPSSRMRACASGLAIHWVFGASSPPMWIQRPGNRPITSVSTFCIEADGRVSGAEDVLVHAPAGPYRDGVSRVAELGIRGDGGLGMARHLDLRHDRHEARGGVGDDLADIVLRIEATVGLAVEAPRGRVLDLSTDERLTAPRAHLGETRVLLDLEAPPLVVGQVPVEAVELMERREIDVLLHELLRHEVTGHVEVDAPPREPGRVLDRNRGDAPCDTGRLRLPEARGREGLPQCLEPVESPRAE